MTDEIRIKPHHFVDVITALGGGKTEYEPHPYGHALHAVARRILADPEVVLCMEFGADDICGPCRHNVGGRCDDVIDTSCRPAAPASKGAWNLLLDQRWGERLGLVEGERLTARELCERIRDRAGDVAGIYREVAADRAAERQTKLEAGAAEYLAT